MKNAIYYRIVNSKKEVVFGPVASLYNATEHSTYRSFVENTMNVANSDLINMFVHDKEVESGEFFQVEYSYDKATWFSDKALFDLRPTTSFAETIVEVIEGAYYQQKDGQYSLHVRDNNLGRTIPEPTLVLVDGLMVQNPNDLFKYPAAGIEQISTHSGIYLYGPTAFNGVISVVTKNQDFISSDKTIVRQNIQRPVPVKKYFRKNHDDSELDLKIPDYRYQLLWMPEINENELTFYASDVNGSYEITIEGFTANGMPVSIRDSFEVK